MMEPYGTAFIALHETSRNFHTISRNQTGPRNCSSLEVPAVDEKGIQQTEKLNTMADIRLR